MTHKTHLVGLLFLVLFLALPTGVRAEYHALLIGIGKYMHLEAAAQLEGPRHDVEAIRDLLTRYYGFKTGNIVMLVDGEASRRNILKAIEKLVDRTRPGDRIFIYFSGHGTSAHDRASSLPLPHASGALVPADFKISRDKDSANKVMARLIVGRRDLKPLLSRLDKGRQVFVAFDACFSGSSVRAISSGVDALRSRHLSIGLRSRGGAGDPADDLGGFKENTSREEPYPYKNIFYLAAASEYEQAKDIGQDTLNAFPTVDDRPHGAFTDAFLRVLMGAVDGDTNHDGQLNQGEIYRTVKECVSARFPHIPHALPRGGPAGRLMSQNFFVRSGDFPKPPSHVIPKTLRVEVARSLVGLRERISAQKGLQVTEENPDLIIRPDGGDLVILLPNAHVLRRFPGADEDKVLNRLRRHGNVRRLAGLTYPFQRFNVHLELTGAHGGVVKEGSPIGFTVRSDVRAYILLLDIDPTGEVHIIYPAEESELRPLKAGALLDLSEMGQVTAPFGTEFVKVFAVRDMPRGLRKVMGREGIGPGSPLFKELEKMTGMAGVSGAERADARKDIAQAVIRVTSYPKTKAK